MPLEWAVVSESNVDVVRTALDAFNRGDQAALLALFTDDAEVYSTEALPNAGRFKGREGYLEWVGAWLDAWDHFIVEPLDYEAIDDRRVVAPVRQRGRGRHSGVEIEMSVVYLFELEAGKVRRFELHVDRPSALAAAADVTES